MNGNYYQNPTFPGSNTTISNRQIEESTKSDKLQHYIEHILAKNKGKRIKIYTNFSNSEEWKDKTFTGILEGTGIDHIVLSEPSSGHWIIIPTIFLSFIDFDEKINFD